MIVRALVVLLAALAGCAYWKAPPRGDTAPSTWGDAPAVAGAAPSDAAPAVPAPTSRPGASPTMSETEARLQNLDGLHQRGVIGAAEYRRRREQLLRAAFE